MARSAVITSSSPSPARGFFIGGTMRPWMMLVGTAALVAGSLDAQQRNAVFSARVQEWVVPWKDSRPRDPYADRQGRESLV